ncbi:hypothetical protein [Candidatus Enterovibrio altilux]|nr:hypothetical protein [Candidatus Enterovibrio luxaltus]
MFQVKKTLGRTLSLRDHTVQISEIYAIIIALNKLAGLGMAKIKVIV